MASRRERRPAEYFRLARTIGPPAAAVQRDAPLPPMASSPPRVLWPAAALASVLGVGALVAAAKLCTQALPSKHAKRYKLGRLIGEGHSGTRVYEALDVRRGCLVAIKVARTTGREIDALRVVRSLAHPNLVGFIEHFFDARRDRCFIVMELMEGGELFKAIRRRRGALYSDEAARRIFVALFAAVRALHGAGVCHRDIKPENVCLVHREGANSTCTAVKLCDFGNSIIVAARDGEERWAGPSARSGDGGGGRRANSPKTKLRGTRGYMAPAMLMKSGDYSFEVDYFSLGVVLYVMLTGYSSEFTGYRSQLRWSGWVASHMKRCGRQGDNSGARALVDMLMDSQSLRLWFSAESEGAEREGRRGGRNQRRGAGEGPLELHVEVLSDRVRRPGGHARGSGAHGAQWAAALREGDAVDARWLTRTWHGTIVAVEEGGTVAVVAYEDVRAPRALQRARVRVDALAVLPPPEDYLGLQAGGGAGGGAEGYAWPADVVRVVPEDRPRIPYDVIGCRVEATFAACTNTWWRARVVRVVEEDVEAGCDEVDEEDGEGGADEAAAAADGANGDRQAGASVQPRRRFVHLKYACAWEQVQRHAWVVGRGGMAAETAVTVDTADAIAAAALPTPERAEATRAGWSARARADGRWKLRWSLVATGVATLAVSVALSAAAIFRSRAVTITGKDE